MRHSAKEENLQSHVQHQQQSIVRRPIGHISTVWPPSAPQV